MITSFFKAKPAAGDAAAASSSTTAVASGSTKDQETPAKENERPVAAAGGTKRAGLAASSPQEELVVVEPETSEHSHKRLRKGKAQVVESDDDEQMDESAPAESAAPKRIADVPDSAEAEGGDADGEKASADGADEAEEAEEAEEEEEEEEAAAAGEEGAKAGPSAAARPLKLKQASKAKGAPPKGSTAATIQYHKYDVAGAATWKAGEGVPYLFLARVFGTVEDEPKRLRITELMANAFRTVLAVSPQDLLPVVRLTTNKIAADYAGIELGIGDSIMIKAVAETCGRSVAAIKESLEQEGDDLEPKPEPEP